MPFIGNQPADKFLTLEKQVFTTSATDTYTLDREVSSVNEFPFNEDLKLLFVYEIELLLLTLGRNVFELDEGFAWVVELSSFIKTWNLSSSVTLW